MMETAVKPMQIPLAERALQLEVSLSMFGNSKKDKTGTEQLKASKHIVKDGRGSASKVLLDPKILAPGIAIQQKLRLIVYKNTVPYDNNGRFLVPTSKWFSTVANEVRQLESEFWNWVDNEATPAIVRYTNDPVYDSTGRQIADCQAQLDLNGAYDQRDYPHPAKLRNYFGFGVHTALLPDYQNLTDTQKNLFGGEIERMQKQLEQRVQAAVSSNLIGRMRDSLKNPDDKNNPGIIPRIKAFKDRVTAKDQQLDIGRKGFFKDSLIDNVKTLVDSIPDLNLTDDPNVKDLAERIKTEVLSFTPETLRSDDKARDTVLASAEEIYETMSYYL